MVGRVLLRVRRGDFKGHLDCRLVDQQVVRPILGQKACLGMKIVTYLDNYQLNKPRIKNAELYIVGDETSFPITRNS